MKWKRAWYSSTFIHVQMNVKLGKINYQIFFRIRDTDINSETFSWSNICYQYCILWNAWAHTMKTVLLLASFASHDRDKNNSPYFCTSNHLSYLRLWGNCSLLCFETPFCRIPLKFLTECYSWSNVLSMPVIIVQNLIFKSMINSLR